MSQGQRLFHHKRLFSFRTLVYLALALILVITLVKYISPKKAQAEDTRLVTIHVDGARRVVASNAPTVGEALKASQVTVGEYDKAEPSLDSPIAGTQFTVNIYRARPVTVVDGAKSYTTITAERSPQTIAKEAGFDTNSEDQFTFSRSDDPYVGTPGTQMIIKRSKTIKLDLYGKVSQLNTHEVTVGEFLVANEISLEEGDELNVSEATKISEGMLIAIAQVGRKVETVEETVPFEEEKIQDVNQPVSYRKIQTPGVDGKKMVTYEILTKNGKPAGKRAIKEVVTKEPVKQVVTVGTKRWSGSLEQWLLALRMCESGGNYQINTGNGFSGAYQFMKSTWDRIAPKAGRPELASIYPYQASPADQDYMIIVNTKLSSGGLASQNPGCYASTGISQFPPE